MTIQPFINPFIQETNELKITFKKFIEECQYLKRLSPQTIKGYTEVFNTFCKCMPEVTTLEDLSAQTVVQFFTRVSQRQRLVGSVVKIGIKPSTLDTYYRKLMVFFNWLEKNKFIENRSISSIVPKPRAPEYRDLKSLTQDEISKITAAISIKNSKDTWQKIRDLTILNLLIFTGIRRGELLGLTVQDIDLEQNLIFINKETSKSKYSRYIPINFQLRQTLESYLNIRAKQEIYHPSLIVSCKRGTAFTEHGLKHWVAKYEKLSGVSFHLHRFRHTFSCNMARAGADPTSIMKLLGHTSLRMTERYLRSIQTKDALKYINKL